MFNIKITKGKDVVKLYCKLNDNFTLSISDSFKNNGSYQSYTKILKQLKKNIKNSLAVIKKNKLEKTKGIEFERIITGGRKYYRFLPNKREFVNIEKFIKYV